jgi:hypothetical protein
MFFFVRCWEILPEICPRILSSLYMLYIYIYICVCVCVCACAYVCTLYFFHENDM